MASEPKTRPTSQDPLAYIDEHPVEHVRDDARVLVDMFQRIAGNKPVMWGSSIIGFGTFRYAYASGKEMDWPLIAFAPRKTNIVVYLTPGYSENNALLANLGKYRTGVGCLYIKKLADVNLDVLEQLVVESMQGV